MLIFFPNWNPRRHEETSNEKTHNNGFGKTAKSSVPKKGLFKSLTTENNGIPSELHGNHGV